MSSYRAGTIKRKRRTKAQVEQLDAQIIAALQQDHPQSVRHVFYLMTDPRLPEPVEKSDRGYRHVQHRCAELRRAGRLPYGWIADMSRRGYFVNTYSDAGEFVRRMANLYRADLWSDADELCEVWAESRSIASVIQDDCEEYAVDLYPCGGFSSMSFVHQAAQAHNQRAEQGDGRPLVVLYIGDLDPAGVLIDVALERELHQHLRGIELDFRRIAINEAQVTEYDLPTKPRKKSDKRSLQLRYTVEAEAMPAHILRELLRDAVEDMLPAYALEIAKLAEKEERRGLLKMAEMLGGS